jgi:hypothetical protein
LLWNIAWDGKATCTISLNPPGLQNIDSAAGRGTFSLGDTSGHRALVFGNIDPQDPPRNIRIWQDRYDANFQRGERFNPDWLEQIRGFHTLRFMDCMQTNNSQIVEFSDIADLNYRSWGSPKGSPYGPKGGVPLALIAELGNATGCTLHFNIPHQATDDCVRKIAEFFKANTNVEVIYEYSNEIWNRLFQQASSYAQQRSDAMFPGQNWRHFKWALYRAAQCMAIIRGVYNDATRWRGAFATMTTTNTFVTQIGLDGINYFLTQDPAGMGLKINDLFQSLMVTGYFGIVFNGNQVTQITRANPAVVTTYNAHGYVNGQKVKMFVPPGPTTGVPRQLDNVTATVANATAKTFELEGVDSSQWPALINNSGDYYVYDAALFTMMEESIALNASDPARYPERATWLSEQLRDSFITGSCEAGFVTSLSLAVMKETVWAPHAALAAANGMDFRQYEGGCGFQGGMTLQGYGGLPQFNELMWGSSHSAAMAEVYTASYAAFSEVGGRYPAKYVDLGADSVYGTWGGMRYVPGDESNPVWRAVRAANDA